jgi:hypothetical protein
VTAGQSTPTPKELAFEAYGARAVVEIDPPSLAARVTPLLPPQRVPCAPGGDAPRFSIRTEGDLAYVERDGADLAPAVALDLALDVFDAQLRIHIASNARGWIFVHAGVVSVAGRAIVIPGASFTGKTTLVAALVRAGAVYYSDEYAVLDEEGLVHPYPRPLSIRENGVGIDHDVSAFGGVAGVDPIPVGTVLVTRYRPGAVWQPSPLSHGRGALALISHAFSVQERSEEVVRAITRSVQDALVVEGDRGEAADLAAALVGRQTP